MRNKFQTSSNVICFSILGILTISTIPVSVSAEIASSPKLILAQLSDIEKQERSQLIQQANISYSQGNLPEAEASLRQLIKKFPEDAFGHYQLGNILFRQGKTDDAINAYQEAIRFQSKYALAYNAIGSVYASQERWQEAITQYKKSLEINPNYGDALTNLGQALWQINQKAEAIASLEKALKVYRTQKTEEKAKRVEKMLRQMKSNDDPSVS
ncbi:tetratricopeptide repeat protein [Calothrix sp. 336/3]|uniref:tetratricopeptide repeat protein n=1 Tax=Calothrix sp. 336/3 TaxID=1337936 RepID=UPI0004E42495|nr:tetratricopeptide repeat protein [Calothrix sp. 336/3]AKG22566.1 tetratricopeptide TPR_1 repeat-containing protein [Calothrix sp. 336/3]